eukprot:795856-Amphidinium_carterae.1
MEGQLRVEFRRHEIPHNRGSRHPAPANHSPVRQMLWSGGPSRRGVKSAIGDKRFATGWKSGWRDGGWVYSVKLNVLLMNQLNVLLMNHEVSRVRTVGRLRCA